MEQGDSHCPYDLCCEPTSQGNGPGVSAGKEDPVELDSSMCEVARRTMKRGGGTVSDCGCVRGHYCLSAALYSPVVACALGDWCMCTSGKRWMWGVWLGRHDC